jgi:hypothetical protein
MRRPAGYDDPQRTDIFRLWGGYRAAASLRPTIPFSFISNG